MRIKCFLVALVFVFVACGGEDAVETTDPPATSTTSTPSSSSTTTTTVAPTSTGSSIVTEAPVEILSETAVVEPHGGERYVNPGVVVEVGGQLHMLANSFTFYPGHSETWHLTSDDGAEWSLQGDAMVFGTNDVPYSDGNVFVFAAYVDAAGQWVAYFDTFDGRDEPGYIGRMTASGPAGPWLVDPEPILEPGEAGAWDEIRVGEPSLLIGDDGTFWMFYTGFNVARGAAIGLATSADGATWSKASDSAVLQPPDWAGSAISGAQVIGVDDGYLMLFQDQANFRAGFATSEDLESWTHVGDGPTVERHHLPTGEELYQSELIRWDGELLWLQEIGPGNRETAIYPILIDPPQE